MTNELIDILNFYRNSFSNKNFDNESDTTDILMNIFGITPALKNRNRQYWGRELGMCWQKLIVSFCREYCSRFQPPLKFNSDEPMDLFIGQDAIDTKYRIGSGDSGTLKKFKQYGNLLKKKGYNPIVLILREDNLPAALTACKSGGWTVYTGNESFLYIKDKTKQDIKKFLLDNDHKFTF